MELVFAGACTGLEVVLTLGVVPAELENMSTKIGANWLHRSVVRGAGVLKRESIGTDLVDNTLTATHTPLQAFKSGFRQVEEPTHNPRGCHFAMKPLRRVRGSFDSCRRCLDGQGEGRCWSEAGSAALL